MQPERTYPHFCPLARALDQVGERWGLLIVRDLLTGPQRFSDLLLTCRGIRPRQLTARLRQLQASGIVERDSAAGRREVWYRLTAAGFDLRPAVESLLLWGVQHVARPPAEDEPVHPLHLLNGTRLALIAAGARLAGPVRWTFGFPGDPYTLRFDGTSWQLSRGADPAADLLVQTTPRGWAQLVMTPARGRATAAGVDLQGAPARTAEFETIFGLAGLPRA